MPWVRYTKYPVIMESNQNNLEASLLVRMNFISAPCSLRAEMEVNSLTTKGGTSLPQAMKISLFQGKKGSIKWPTSRKTGITTQIWLPRLGFEIWFMGSIRQAGTPSADEAISKVEVLEPAQGKAQEGGFQQLSRGPGSLALDLINKRPTNLRKAHNLFIPILFFSRCSILFFESWFSPVCKAEW